MRVDKFLWSIRIFKSRSLATDHCKSNKVSINGEIVKPSREVKINDLVMVRKGAVTYSYQVKDIPKSRVGAKLVEDFSIDVTTEEELEKIEIIRLTNKFERDRGLGRPTKKDRRDLNRFKEDD